LRSVKTIYKRRRDRGNPRRRFVFYEPQISPAEEGVEKGSPGKRVLTWFCSCSSPGITRGRFSIIAILFFPVSRLYFHSPSALPSSLRIPRPSKAAGSSTLDPTCPVPLPVPEASTLLSGVLTLLPSGTGMIRVLRKGRFPRLAGLFVDARDSLARKLLKS
jgi:hypothetical protein